MKWPTVSDVYEIPARGPWTTKSGGTLSVLLAIPATPENEGVATNHPFVELNSYDPNELAGVSQDIRGVRIYSVTNLPAGQIGGTEFHRIRKEIILGLTGEVEWTVEDLVGNHRTFTISPSRGVYMPPFILHTYRVLREMSGLLVFCNTLFPPDDPAAHDTYSTENFSALQAEIRLK